MARTVEDCALMLQAMAGHDPMDSTSADLAVPDWAGGAHRRRARPADRHPQGVLRSPACRPRSSAIWRQGADWLRAQGAELVEVSLPHTKYALPTYYIIAPAEASSNLARYDGMRFGLRVEGRNLAETYMKTRAAGFGAEVQRRILIGTYVLSAGYYDAYYLKAQKVRRRIVEDFTAAFERVDAHPDARPHPRAPFRAGEKMDDPVAMYLNDVFTVTVEPRRPARPLGARPASTPTACRSGLQVIGRAWDEATVFQVGKALEEAAGFDDAALRAEEAA